MTATLDMRLYKDLVFYAGFGQQKEYFETLHKFPESIRQEMINKTFKIISMENKNESTKIAKKIIQDITDEKIVLEGIENCYQTKILNEEIEKSFPPENIKSISKRTWQNCKKLLEFLALSVEPKALAKLHPATKDYITKQFPDLHIPDLEAELQVKIDNDHEFENSFAVDICQHINDKFQDFNLNNKEKNLEIFAVEHRIENKHVLKITVLSFNNKKSGKDYYKLIINNGQLVVLTNPAENEYFKSIGIIRINQLHTIITNNTFFKNKK